ncbi:MAG: Nitrogen assimilation regulatory protein [Synergistetes bacterium ADurb.BinA166]|nr:MAG: Nitrogen assimilation regulatory protein [Synergistetes bacterium ADurb.BinA166]
MHLILVDDDKMVLDSLARAMGRHFSVTAFVSAREALEHVATGAPADAVLTDVRMHPMGGAELGREMAKVRSDLPVFYMSGQSVDLPEPSVCFAKPFDVRQAATLIHMVVQSEKALREMKDAGIVVDPKALRELEECVAEDALRTGAP